MTSALPLPTIQGQEYAPGPDPMIPGEDIGKGGRPDVLGRGMSWDHAVDLWADWMRTEGIRERTIELRRYQISHLGEEILRRSPWRVKADDLVLWLARQDWAQETRRSYRYAIRSFYGWAVRAKYTKHNPAAELRGPKMVRGMPRPTPDRVLNAALAKASDADRMMLYLAAYAGLRRAEIASMRLDNIEEDELRIIGKGDVARDVPIHPTLAAELTIETKRRAAGRRGTGYRYAHGAADGWLFPGRSGGHLTPNAVGKRLASLLGPGWTGHSLRHRFLTRILENSGNLAVAQELAGHVSPATTRIYTRVSAAAKRQAVDAL